MRASKEGETNFKALVDRDMESRGHTPMISTGEEKVLQRETLLVETAPKLVSTSFKEKTIRCSMRQI